MIKNDVMEMFRELHDTELFMRALNSTFIALIPKKKVAKKFDDLGL